GCCLNAGALATLHAAGLGGLAARSGAVALQNIELAAGNRSVLLPLVGGAVLSREAFDAALVQAAIDAGVRFMPATLASLGDAQPAARRVFLQQGERRREVSARLVLVAIGLAGLGRSGAGDFQPAVAEGSRIGAGVVATRAPAFYRDGTVFM